MVLPVIDGVMRVAVEWTCSDLVGLSAVNVMHFWTNSETQASLLPAMNSNWQTHQGELMDSDTTVLRATAQELDGVSASIVGTLDNWTGSSGSGDNSPAYCAVVRLGTALSGRSHRGRIFLPFVLESVITNGLFDAPNAAELAAAWADFQTAMQVDGWNQVVASYLLEEQQEVTNYSVDRVAGIQRRRQERLH